MNVYLSISQCYSFKRQPNEAEWDILQSYTRRIWHILGYANPDGWLDNDSLIAICSPPVTDPLFPNLRSLYWQGITMIPAMYIAVPSLTSLYLNFTLGHVPALKDFLDSIGALCPNIKQLRIYIPRPHPFDETIRSHIRRQTNLQAFDCRGVILDADTISHLSKISTLTHLSFRLVLDVFDWIPSSGSAFVFSSLARLDIKSKSLESVMGLLSCTRLPVVEHLGVDFLGCPSKETFGSYITTVRNTCPSHPLTSFEIRGMKPPIIFGGIYSESPHRLTLDDIGPCMAFSNLLHLNINLPWSVDLTDSDLLALVSTWPHVHTLLINNEWGWRTTGGITLHGLLQLLQKRRSLSTLCVAIHTESYTHLPHEVETGFLPQPGPLMIDLADSPIQPADVPALVEVFVKLGLFTHFFSAWDGLNMEVLEGAMVYKRAWNQVFDQVMEKFPGPRERNSVADGESG